MSLDQREYVLKWHSFGSTIQTVFRRLLNKSAFADVTLVAAGCSVACHRLVLSACSSYFEDVLLEHPHPHPIIILHDVPAPVLQPLVTFMYSGEIRLPHDRLQCFLQAAETLKVKGLTETKAGVGVDCQLPPLVPVVSCVSGSPPRVSSPPPATAPPPPLRVRGSCKRRTPEPSAGLDAPLSSLGALVTVCEDQALALVKRPRSRASSATAAVLDRPPEQLQLPVDSRPDQTVLAVTSAGGTSGGIVVECREQQQQTCDSDIVENGGCLLVDQSAGGVVTDQEDDVEADDGEEDVDEGDSRLEQDMELVSGDEEDDGGEDSSMVADGPTSMVQLDHGTANAIPSGSPESSDVMASCSDESPPWRDPKWSGLLPEDKVLEAMGNMLDVPTLAAKLMKNLFSEEERISSNTTGDHGKQIFDKEKMELIKLIVLHVSKISEEDYVACDDLWVRCKMKIDKWNRDLRYARKKKDKDTSTPPTLVRVELCGGAVREESEYEREAETAGCSIDRRWPMSDQPLHPAGCESYPGERRTPPSPASVGATDLSASAQHQPLQLTDPCSGRRREQQQLTGGSLHVEASAAVGRGPPGGEDWERWLLSAHESAAAAAAAAPPAAQHRHAAMDV